MWIKELHVTAFGKLKNLDITLERGFNIIKGGNEAGKSTLHAFIFAMLFGAPRGRGKASKEELYSRFKPWDSPGSFQGSMVIEHEGEEYLLERVFLSADRSCLCRRMSDGREINLKDGKITSLIPELDEAAFRNTMSVRQEGISPDDAMKGLVDGIAASLVSRTDNEINVAGAKASLKDKEKELVKQLKAGELKAAEEHFKQGRDILAALDEAEKEYCSAKLQLDALERELADDSGIRQLACELQDWRQSRGEETEGTEEDSTEGKLHETTNVERSNSTIRKLFRAALGALIVAFVSFIVGNDRFLPILVVSILSLIAAIVCISAAFIKRREVESHKKADERERLAELEEERQRIEQKEERLRICYEQELEKRAALMSRRDRLVSSLDPLYRSYCILCDKAEDPHDMEAAVREAERKEKDLKAELEAVRLALSTIESISTNYREMFDRRIAGIMSEYCAAFTDGRYNRMTQDENLRLCVWDGSRAVDVSLLSVGARNQAELARRLAVYRMRDGRTELPLILDEVFCYFDDARTKSALDTTLEEFSNQIILFTSGNREERLLAGVANVISL